MNDKELTLLRRRQIGFVFQAFNLVPDADGAGEHRAAARHRGTQDRPELGRGRDRAASGSTTAATTGPPSCRAASSSASPSRGRSCPSRPCCSPTSRPATSTRSPAPRCWSCSARPVGRVRADDRHGHPRPARRGRGRPRRQPGRRPGRERRGGGGMIRATLKSMSSRRLRTALTAIAIVLGVAMVSGAYTLTDTMRGAADSLSKSSYDGTAAVVSAKTAFEVERRRLRRSSDRPRRGARPGSRARRPGGRQHHRRGPAPRTSPAT